LHRLGKGWQRIVHTPKTVAFFFGQLVPACTDMRPAMGFPSSAATPAMDCLEQLVPCSDPSKVMPHVDWAMGLAMRHAAVSGGEMSKVTLLAGCITVLAWSSAKGFHLQSGVGKNLTYSLVSNNLHSQRYTSPGYPQAQSNPSAHVQTLNNDSTWAVSKLAGLSNRK